MAEKKFYDYFVESMKSAGIPESTIPDGSVFGTASSASAAVVALAEAAKMIGARATLAELIGAMTVNGGLGAGGAGLVAVGAAKATAGVLAAYWVGCVIGAILYAIQMTTFGDSWMDKLTAANATSVFEAARIHGVNMPPMLEKDFSFACVVEESRMATA